MIDARGPRYVNRWGFQGSPQPFICRDLTAYCFVLKGALSNIQDLCRRYLREPANGEVEYRALSPYLILTFTRTPALAAVNPPYNALGRYPEIEAAFWVLTAVVKREAGLEVAERLAWFNPYMMVDNPLALSDGREIYGYPKEYGWFELPDTPKQSEHVALDVLATARFGPDAIGMRQRLLEMNRTDGGKAAETLRALTTVEDVTRMVADVMLHDPGLVPGLSLAEDLLDSVLHHRGRQVFLKQFYDVADGDRACYQAIVEAPVQVVAFRQAGILPGEYRLTLHDLDTHPVRTDLGLQDGQSAVLGYWMDFDFTLETGSTIWKAP
jgi:hypothetical protein